MKKGEIIKIQPAEEYTMANKQTIEHPRLTLWMVDPLRESKWPQDNNIIAGMCLQSAHAKVAKLNEGREPGVELFVLHDVDMNPLFA